MTKNIPPKSYIYKLKDNIIVGADAPISIFTM